MTAIAGLVVAQVVGFSLRTNAAPPCGDPLSSEANHRGVVALSNDPYMRSRFDCADRGTYGDQYQCVEYVRRFYSALGFNTSTTEWLGHALTYSNDDTAAQRGLLLFRNGKTPVRPKPDDIVVFSGGTFGHVAIVKSVEPTNVTVVEQNFSDTGLATIPLSVDNGQWSLGTRGSFTVVGWLRERFNFAVGFLAVDGNILSSGNADNVIDFLDNFNDGSLTTPPTSSLSIFQPVEESGGFMHFRSADGARTVSRFGRTFIEDDIFLIHSLSNSAGNAEIIVSFRADAPAPRQFYGIGTVNSGSTLLESMAVGVSRGTDGVIRVLTNDHTGTTLAVDAVTLPSNGFLLLKLFVDDATNQVIASYSIDNGATFIRADQFDFFLRHGTIFNVTSQAFIFAQGGVRLPEPTGTIEVKRIDGAGAPLPGSVPTTAAIDTGVEKTDNPAFFADLLISNNPHTIGATDRPEYIEEVATCNTPGCTLLPGDPNVTYLPADCDGIFCSLDVNVLDGGLTRVVFLYDECAPGFEKSGSVCVPTTTPLPQPEVVITAMPTIVLRGSTSTISWTSSVADSCTVTDPNGVIAEGSCPGFACAGSSAETINHQSTFSIACENAGGSATASVTVRLVPVFGEF